MIITQRSIFTNGKLAKFGMDLFLRKGKYDKFCGFAKKKNPENWLILIHAKINLALFTAKINLLKLPRWNWYS